MPRDLATWGIILSIAAIALAIPLSVIGNLLTPKVRNWWAGRSAKAMRRRINELEENLADMEKYSLISEVEEEMLSMLPKLDMFITETIMLALGAVMALVTVNGREFAWKATLIGVGTIAVLALSRIAIFGDTYTFIRRRSPSQRNRVRSQIEKLKMKLATKI